MFFICLATLLVTLTLYLWKVYSRFSKHGVKYIRPIPFLGNAGKLAINKSHIADDFKRLYNAFPGERFVGHFELMRPVIMIKDLDLIKHITVKDFQYFHDHRHMVDESVDPLFGRNLVTLKGQEWKDMRCTLSPIFTSVKMRAMIPFMLDVNDQMIRSIRKKIEQTEAGHVDIDCKDLTTRYSNDVLASCGFGMKLDSHADSENEFYSRAKSTAHFSFRRVLVFLGYSAFPNLMKAKPIQKLNVKMFNEKSNDYFEKLFNNTIMEREQNDIIRPDMIHLLLEAKRGKLMHNENNESNNAGFASVEESNVGRRSIDRSWSDSDLVAQAIFFLVASFESISATMCFLLYEVAVNPEVQERLVKEFKDNEAKNKECDYYALQNLKYLDMVLSEVLRLWPFGTGIDRVCTNNYNLGKPNDRATCDYIIKKGELIIIPTCAIHHDPEYFPNPSKFDPERFSDKNRMNIKPYSYMPFGTGPRNCIGSRFALFEVKVMIYHLLLRFELSPAEKTRIPAELLPAVFTVAMQGGHWIRFKSRLR